MRKLALFAFALLAFSLRSVAAEMPKLELFGGYSFFRADFNESLTSVPAQNTSGWGASVSVPFYRFLSVTADFSGQYKSASAFLSGAGSARASVHEYNFLFGPTATYRNKSRFTPFVHALFGVSHLTASASLAGLSASGSDDAFGMAIGGGADLKFAKMFSLRLGQFDWLRTQHFNQTQNNLRYSTGLVVTF